MMTEFGNMFRISGYSEKERLNFIKGALSIHKEMLTKVERRENITV